MRRMAQLMACTILLGAGVTEVASAPAPLPRKGASKCCWLAGNWVLSWGGYNEYDTVFVEHTPGRGFLSHRLRGDGNVSNWEGEWQLQGNLLIASETTISGAWRSAPYHYVVEFRGGTSGVVTSDTYRGVSFSLRRP